MTDYTDPLGKWWVGNISRFTEKMAVDDRPFPIIDALAMLRDYVAETQTQGALYWQDKYLAAEAELAEARRDSARLEWVVKNRAIAYPTSAVERPWICYVRTGRDRERWGGASFREAVDAAMAEAQPKEPA